MLRRGLHLYSYTFCEECIMLPVITHMAYHVTIWFPMYLMRNTGARSLHNVRKDTTACLCIDTERCTSLWAVIVYTLSAKRYYGNVMEWHCIDVGCCWRWAMMQPHLSNHVPRQLPGSVVDCRVAANSLVARQHNNTTAHMSLASLKNVCRWLVANRLVPGAFNSAHYYCLYKFYESAVVMRLG
jgi:hypothetical protein